MKINKQAAIKTAKVFLYVILVSVLTSLFILNVSFYAMSILFSVVMICTMIYTIYKVSLDQIKLDESEKQREQLCKKLDEERYSRKMIRDEIK